MCEYFYKGSELIEVGVAFDKDETEKSWGNVWPDSRLEG